MMIQGQENSKKLIHIVQENCSWMCRVGHTFQCKVCLCLTEDGESVGSDADSTSAGSDDEEYKIDKLDSTSARKRLKQSRRSSLEHNNTEMNKDRIAVSIYIIFMYFYIQVALGNFSCISYWVLVLVKKQRTW